MFCFCLTPTQIYTLTCLKDAAFIYINSTSIIFTARKLDLATVKHIMFEFIEVATILHISIETQAFNMKIVIY